MRNLPKPRTNLTRIPLLLGSIAVTAISPRFESCWAYCVVGWSRRLRVWPSFYRGTDLSYCDHDDVATYLNISRDEAYHVFVDGTIAGQFDWTRATWTRRQRIARVWKLIRRYAAGLGDVQ